MLITHGWKSHAPVIGGDHTHEPRTMAGSDEQTHVLLPRDAPRRPLVKRWLLGTLLGAVAATAVCSSTGCSSVHTDPAR